MPLSLLSAALAALLLDALLGEPRRAHPLVLVGRLAAWLEQRFNREGGSVLAGGVALLLVILPILSLLVWLLAGLPEWAGWGVQAIGLWLVIGARSLVEHGRAVEQPLMAGDVETARQRVAWIVSRDCEALDDEGIAKAATESVLENGADAIFASLFWFLVAGLPGAVLHRLVNTLDAMWGYRTARFERFGKVAARLDDLLGWLPARLTALSYALCGHFSAALRCWRQQASGCDSPNAGPVMAAGAGALQVRLGGVTRYHGRWKEKPELGEGQQASAHSIGAAIRLIHRSLLLWIAIMMLLLVAGA